MAKKEHYIFLDYLRAFAAMAVVMLHTITGIMDTVDMSGYPAEQKIFLSILDLVCWCVPIFLMISGYLFLDSKRKISGRQIVTKNMRRILLALIVFGIPYAFMELIVVEKTFYPEMVWISIKNVCLGKTWAHMWYLYLILLLYAITPVLRYVLFRIPVAVVIGIQIAVFVICSVFPFMNLFLDKNVFPVYFSNVIYFFYYICGYLFAYYENRKTSKNSFYGHKMSIFLTILVAFVMVMSRCLGYRLRMAYNDPFTVVLAILLFLIGWTGENVQRKNIKLLYLISTLSFGIYLVHPVFLNIYYKILHLSLFSYWIGFTIPAFFFVTMIPSILTVVILRKSKILRDYVL